MEHQEIQVLNIGSKIYGNFFLIFKSEHIREIFFTCKDKMRFGAIESSFHNILILVLTLFVYCERNWLEKCSLESKPFFVGDMLMIFLSYSNQQIVSKHFMATVIFVTLICPFYLRKNKIKHKMTFLDVGMS